MFVDFLKMKFPVESALLSEEFLQRNSSVALRNDCSESVTVTMGKV